MSPEGVYTLGAEPSSEACWIQLLIASAIPTLGDDGPNGAKPSLYAVKDQSATR